MKAISILLLLFLLLTAGCAVIGSSQHDSFATKDLVIPSDPNASETPSHVVASIDHEVQQLEIDRTPLGSYVHVTVLNQPFQGTLLRKESKKLVLVNSMSNELVVDSDGRKYGRKSHTPFQIVVTSQMSHFSILAPPSDKFSPTGMRYHSDDLTVDAFEFHSGRIQRWFEPTINSTFRRQECSPIEWEQKLAEIPLGSQVVLLDESGRTSNAILSRTGQDGLMLLNYMTQESVPGLDGSRQLKTSCVPWQTIPIQSISSCSVVNSAPSDLAPATDDDHCDVCVTDIIYKSGRRQSDWKSAQNEREVVRILTGRPKWLTLPSL